MYVVEHCCQDYKIKLFKNPNAGSTEGLIIPALYFIELYTIKRKKNIAVVNSAAFTICNLFLSLSTGLLPELPELGRRLFGH